MRRGLVGIILGALLIAFGVVSLLNHGDGGAVVPMVIGAGLVYLGLRPGRGPVIVFGHALVVTGSFLVAWGIILVPRLSPTWQVVLLTPLFWGFITIFGGICAIYHGFCRCVGRRDA
jgi:hypothetical protein